MICPRCAFKQTSCTDSRPRESGTAVMRRRLCGSCGHRFTTYEEVADRSRERRLAEALKVNASMEGRLLRAVQALRDIRV